MPFLTVTITVVSLAPAAIPVNSQMSESKVAKQGRLSGEAHRLNVKILSEALENRHQKFVTKVVLDANVRSS